MRKSITAAVILVLTLGWFGAAGAGEAEERDREIADLKARVARLEAAREKEKAKAAQDKDGFLKTVEVSGFVTAIGQGTAGNEPGDKNGANVSADLFISARPTATSTVGLHFDMARGAGISTTPGRKFAIGRFGGCLLGGPNADLEYNSDIPHLVEAWYEQGFAGQAAVVTFGILDPTVYFDNNAFANNERLQFLADTFVNNPGIAWGGDSNGYGPGVRLTVSPAEWLAVSLGGFATHTVPTGGEDQDEVIGFENEFDQPFGILEVDLRLWPLGREGNYRFYAWYNANKDTFVRFDNNKGRGVWGVGGSFDQYLTDTIGAFLRWSKQDGSVHEPAGPGEPVCGTLDYHVSGGLSATGLIPGRGEDVAAIGYAVGWLSGEFAQAVPGLKTTEQWIEAYYSIQVNPRFFVSPDVQYVINPGGEGGDFFIWGLRANAVF